MAIDDRTADRQAHAKAAWLRRVEGFEQVAGLDLAEADAGVFDGNDRPGVVIDGFAGRADDEPASLGRTLARGLGGVDEEIDEDLLELDAIAEDQRQVRGYRRKQGDA